MFLPRTCTLWCYYYRFNPSAAAVAYGAHNDFAANPTKLRVPPTLPPPPPTIQPPTAAATSAAAASMGYHQPPTAAVSRWTEFGKPTAASAIAAVDFPVASYFNNNLLWYRYRQLNRNNINNNNCMYNIVYSDHYNIGTNDVTTSIIPHGQLINKRSVRVRENASTFGA